MEKVFLLVLTLLACTPAAEADQPTSRLVNSLQEYSSRIYRSGSGKWTGFD